MASIKTFIVATLVLVSSVCFGQAWSGILTTSRAIDWTKVGLPGTITYGTGGSACNGSLTNCVETTTNPWTPPTRVQSGSTITCANTSADAGTINTALAAANPGSYVLIGAGTCDITSTITMKTGVTLRGSGPMSTIFNQSGVSINWGAQSTSFNGALSGSPAAGATSITVTGANDSGGSMAGAIARLSQCNTGASGWSSYQTCTSGSATDNGGLFVCNDTGCAVNPTNSHAGQVQIVYVTGVSGNCTTSCTVTIAEGLDAPNWTSSQSAHLEWGSGPAQGAGLEDLSIIRPSPKGSNTSASLNGYGSWVKGVRFLGVTSASPSHLDIDGLHNLVMSNYFFGQGNNYTNGADTEPVGRATDTHSLLLNNIMTGGEGYWGNGYLDGEALVYNYSQYDQAVNSINNIVNHGDGTELFTYLEGNELPLHHMDNNHISNDLVTELRNYFSGSDGPFWNANPDTVQMDNFQRFINFVANVYGTSIGPFASANTYKGAGCCNKIFAMPSSDTLATVSGLWWGNTDQVTAGTRWCGRTDPNYANPPCSSTSEMPDSVTMPSGTYPNAVSWQNSTPANHNVPCSFYFSSSTSACVILTNGGTGFSWWKVCKTWTTFPTACAATQTQPYPPIGPDQTGGQYVSGHAFDIPAAIAFTNLPIDTTYQTGYTISASSWSASSCASEVNTVPGPCEILTVNVNTTFTTGTYHIVGPFRLSGVNAACLPTSGVSYTGITDSSGNHELLMTGNTGSNGVTSITIVYALGSSSPDNGSSNQCTGGGSGTFIWPDVRQFDERVYQADTTSTSAPDVYQGIVVQGVVLQ